MALLTLNETRDREELDLEQERPESDETSKPQVHADQSDLDRAYAEALQAQLDEVQCQYETYMKQRWRGPLEWLLYQIYGRTTGAPERSEDSAFARAYTEDVGR